MKKNEEKVSDGLKSEEKPVEKPRSVIERRLGAGQTIQLNIKTKAQLLMIISGTETNEPLSRSSIIEEGRNLRIVLIADPYAPVVSLHVYTVENRSEPEDPRVG